MPVPEERPGLEPALLPSSAEMSLDSGELRWDDSPEARLRVLMFLLCSSRNFAFCSLSLPFRGGVFDLRECPLPRTVPSRKPPAFLGRCGVLVLVLVLAFVAFPVPALMGFSSA